MLLSFPTWRLVIDEHAGQLAQALADELGPIRARAVAISTTDEAIVATIDSGDDPMTTAWWAVVQLSTLWTAGGLMEGTGVGVVVEVAGRRIVTGAAGMQAVVDGCERGAWEPAVEGRTGLRVVR